MTIEVNLYEFLMRQRPICTQFPLTKELGEDFKELRLKYRAELGFDLFDGRCGNTFNCLVADSCVGRPFPKDPLVHKYLESLNVTITDGVYKGVDVYLAKPLLDCSECPFKTVCDEPCLTHKSYYSRRINPSREPRDEDLVDYQLWEEGVIRLKQMYEVEECPQGEWLDDELAWDCLSPRQRECLHMNLIQEINHEDIAYSLNISRQVVSQHISIATQKITEFSKARKILKRQTNPSQRAIKYYRLGMTQVEIADQEGVSQQSISNYISKWRKSNNI